MKVALGSDHDGYILKGRIKSALENKEIDYTDFGTFKIEECDYPEFAFKVTTAIQKDDYDRGVLICGTGLGMAISANKMKGIRAVIVDTIEAAQQSRLYFDSNVLCLAAKLPESKAFDIVEVWLQTSFEGGKYEKRIGLINKLTGL